MTTLKELYRELANDEISSVTVYDDMNGTEEQFGFLEDVLDWYGEKTRRKAARVSKGFPTKKPYSTREAGRRY